MEKIYFVQESKISYKNGKRAKFTVKNEDSAVDFIRNHTEMKDFIEHHEMMYALYLNRVNEVVGVLKVSEGGINATAVDVRLIFQGALMHNASAMIVAHNHPSGSLVASPQDKSFARKLVEAGKILDIKVLDNIIITSEFSQSFHREI